MPGRLRDGTGKRVRNPAGERILQAGLTCCDSLTCLLCKICGFEISKADWTETPGSDCYDNFVLVQQNCTDNSGQDGNDETEEGCRCSCDDATNDENIECTAYECKANTVEYWPLDCAYLNGPWKVNDSHCQTIGNFFSFCNTTDGASIPGLGPSYTWGTNLGIYLHIQCTSDGAYIYAYTNGDGFYAKWSGLQFIPWIKYFPFPIDVSEILEGTLPVNPAFGGSIDNAPYSCMPDGDLEYKAILKGDPKCLECNDPRPPQSGPCEDKLPIDTTITINNAPSDRDCFNPFPDLCPNFTCLEIRASGTCNEVPVDHVTFKGDLLPGVDIFQDGDDWVLRQAYCRGGCGPRALVAPKFTVWFYCDEDEELCKTNRPVSIGGNYAPDPDECDLDCCSDPDNQVTISYPESAPAEATAFCFNGSFGDCGTAPSCAAPSPSGSYGIVTMRFTVNHDNPNLGDAWCCLSPNISIEASIVHTGGPGTGGAAVHWCSDTHVKKVGDCEWLAWRCGTLCNANENCGGADTYYVGSIGFGVEEPILYPAGIGQSCSSQQSFLVASTTYNGGPC